MTDTREVLGWSGNFQSTVFIILPSYFSSYFLIKVIPYKHIFCKIFFFLVTSGGFVVWWR